MPHTPNDRTHRRHTDRRRDAYARDDRWPAPSASAGWRALDDRRVLPDGSGVPARETAAEYLPHLAENIANARRDGAERERLADTLEAVADMVRAGEFDPAGFPSDDDASDRRADGGAAIPSEGEHVRDRDGDAGDVLLVIETLPDTRADEHRIPATGQTVAQHNPDYPPWAPVIRAVYRDDLDAVTEWRELDDLRALVEGGQLRAYTFPAPRLTPLPDRDTDADDAGVTD